MPSEWWQWLIVAVVGLFIIGLLIQIVVMIGGVFVYRKASRDFDKNFEESRRRIRGR